MIANSKTMQPRLIKTAQSDYIENRIRDRAYQLYEQRGSVDGFAWDDWFLAEGEVLRALKQTKVKSAKSAT